MRAITAGVVLGVGLGGFADGIVLHQIAQWHNMGSAVLPPVTMDAMAGTWSGTACSTSAPGWSRCWHRQCGAMRDGTWHVPVVFRRPVFRRGAFNLVEGVSRSPSVACITCATCQSTSRIDGCPALGGLGLCGRLTLMARVAAPRSLE